MGDKEVVKIRCATAEDYDGVMAIDDKSNEGRDYLPAMYPSSWTQSTGFLRWLL